MAFSDIRKFLGATIQGFGMASYIFSDWIVTRSSDVSMVPDASRGLIYPCHPKSVAWYYSAFTIVKSWDFLAFGLMFFLGLVICWADETARNDGRGFEKAYGKAGVPAFALGALMALWFVARVEPVFVDWLLAKGLGPPALACSPLYNGR